jgi:hypothetical protein
VAEQIAWANLFDQAVQQQHTNVADDTNGQHRSRTAVGTDPDSMVVAASVTRRIETAHSPHHHMTDDQMTNHANTLADQERRSSSVVQSFDAETAGGDMNIDTGVGLGADMVGLDNVGGSLQ